MMDWRLLPLETKNGYFNMALDEAILEAVILQKSPNTVRFYKWDPSTASIGRNQSLNREININYSKNAGFNIVRRITGGGAVFHDNTGEITYSIICPIKFLKSLNATKVIDQFEIITHGIVRGLRIYGLLPEKGIIHCPALFLDGKKFSGNAQVRKRGYLLQHGTILLEINPDLMYSVLKAPPNVGKSRMVRSVRAKCIGIKEQIELYDEGKFISCLIKGFENTLNINLVEGTFSEYELDLAENLVETKYSRKWWLNKYE